MPQKTPEHTHACPLFAEWKLMDAAHEFKTTLGIPDIAPVTRIPLTDALSDALTGALTDALTDALSDALTDAGITHQTHARYLSLTITGWHRARRGCRFVFEIIAEAAYPRFPITDPLTDAGITHPLTTLSHTPVHLPVTAPRGYLATLQRMHRHAMPLTSFESLIGGALARVFDRRQRPKNHRCRPLFITTDATRITLPDGKIYDLPLGCHLSPEEAASEKILRQSHTAYRIARGYECRAPCHNTVTTTTSQTATTTNNPTTTNSHTANQTATNSHTANHTTTNSHTTNHTTTTSQASTPQTFLTADLHLGHHHAIRYYCRPFLSDDTDTMDSVLIDNWNHTVSPDDSVIFAGDFTYKADRDTVDAYRSRLNGTVTWIQGNHDTCLDNTEPSRTITADGRDLLIIHNPKHVPDSYDGWVIHAHTHNARLETHPFISFTHKTVNISTDVTGYRPVPLTEVCALISAGETAGRTAPIIIREMPATTDITR